MNARSLALFSCLALAGMVPRPLGAGTTTDPQVARSRPAVDLTTAIAQLAKKTIPAVVHIEVVQRQEVVEPASPFEGDPLFRFFFDAPRGPRKFRRETRGLGSGMIMDASGNILTNHHVVAGASEIDVLLADGNHQKATLVGQDPKTDLAVIRISPRPGLPFVSFGNSDATEVGEWVVAIGHPRGLDQTVTQGIISAKHRRGITDPSGYQDFLQTDAAVNPGNSGGPLLNLSGEVIGVNAAIVSESGGFEGISFAIPSNMALHVARSLIAKGRVERGWLGVNLEDLTPDLARTLGLPSPRGALVGEVVRDGPGAAAGLRRGDVILGVGTAEVADAGTVRNAIANAAVGQEVRLIVWRAGARREVVARVASPQQATAVLSLAARERLGISVRPLRPAEGRRDGMGVEQGVAIQSLDPGSPLALAGLERGDILLEIDGKAIEGVQGFAELSSALVTGQRVTLLAVDHRTGQSGYLQLRLH